MDRKRWAIKNMVERDRYREREQGKGARKLYIPAQLSTMCMLCMPIEATEMCIGTLVAHQCNRAVSNCFHDMVHQLNFQPDLTWLVVGLLLMLAERMAWCLGMRFAELQYYPVSGRNREKKDKNFSWQMDGMNFACGFSTVLPTTTERNQEKNQNKTLKNRKTTIDAHTRTLFLSLRVSRWWWRWWPSGTFIS